MKIPSRVRIGAALWKVKKVDRLPPSDGDKFDNLGFTIYSEETIYLARTCNGRKVNENCMADTFLHEINHAVSQTYGIGLSEDQVCGMTGGQLAVFRSNKLDFSDRSV